MDYVCVIGGANIDIAGTPFTSLKLRDSNPCNVTFSCGGVARNIAENLARLGVKVKFITVLGTDGGAETLKQNALETGIDLSDCIVFEGITSTYICVNDSGGDMYVAASDMESLKKLTPEYLKSKLDVINGAKCVVADTNIPECLNFLRKNVTVPLFVDTVSAKKTMLVKDRLSGIFCLKPNRYEAEILSNFEITDERSLRQAAESIYAQGVSWVFVSDGANGVTYYDGCNYGKAAAYKVDVISTTGAGDAFTAGAVYGLYTGKDIKECAEIGSAAAAVAVLSKDTVSKEMNYKSVERIMKGALKR